MLVLAIVLGAVIGGIIAVIGTLLVRGDLGIHMPNAVDPEYRHHEVVSCGLMMAIGLKAGSVGAGVGALIGLLLQRLVF
ncbi:MAG: hypothetical protein O3A93_11620 [Chloroflexi bacterium]|nr:hypothetical protein [Chloroflexota bacterium]MDA1271887.1 hypothetical protein [Chloroflexota bacterium]